MALVKCKECGEEISNKAEACPKCGAPIKAKPRQYGCGTLIVLGLLVWLFVVIGRREETPSHVSPASSPAAQIVAPPPQPTEAEKAKAAEIADQLRPTRWHQNATDDAMTGKPIVWATVESLNTIEFDFPYQGPQRATLALRDHPKHGKDAYISMERGQFLCRTDNCGLTIKFDDGKPQWYRASETDNGSSETLFITEYARFLAALRKAKTVKIEAQFYDQPSKVFEFENTGLNWK